MRIRSKVLTGRIDPNGNANLNWAGMEDFFHLHRGEGVIVRVCLVPKEPSERLTNYFFGYVVKEMRNAYYEVGYEFSDSQAYDEIRKVCPMFFEEIRENGKWIRRAKEWEELDISEAVNAVAWIQRYASENLHYIIEDPQ